MNRTTTQQRVARSCLHTFMKLLDFTQHSARMGDGIHTLFWAAAVRRATAKPAINRANAANMHFGFGRRVSIGALLPFPTLPASLGGELTISYASIVCVKPNYWLPFCGGFAAECRTLPSRNPLSSQH